ncbi:hypothetical protein FRC97_22415 [Paracidovorax citrulli]|uniref:hypothetical protein n=1 Tax=Paracidovorax citrulli TaxID=80869 RepID=UPI00031B4217|nr:hypothetical protein [Paracidovorax citrulli]UMT97505.1 hypothetical protein FRC97_22415 [Paracidovorax citrulli]
MLKTHAIARALDRQRFDETEDGLLLAHDLGIKACGEYTIAVNGGPAEVERNRIPSQGFNYLLSAALAGGTVHPQFYIALFSGAYTPTDAVTAATFSAAATEITSNTEGYSEGLRQLWVPGAAANGVIDAVANKAVFTVATATSLTVRGAALLSESIKGSTSGTLVSVARFSKDRVYFDGDKVEIGYRIRLQPLAA